MGRPNRVKLRNRGVQKLLGGEGHHSWCRKEPKKTLQADGGVKLACFRQRKKP